MLHCDGLCHFVVYAGTQRLMLHPSGVPFWEAPPGCRWLFAVPQRSSLWVKGFNP